MKVYIAGPYTKGDVAENVANAIRTADSLLSYDFYPYVPHLAHFWHVMCQHEKEIWMELDKEYLRVCDCVYRIPGDSDGADEEVALAKELGIPVVYNTEKLLDLRRQQH